MHTHGSRPPGCVPAPLAHGSRPIGAMLREAFFTCGWLSIGRSAHSRPSTGATKAVCRGEGTFHTRGGCRPGSRDATT